MRDRLIELVKNAEKAFPKDKPVLDIEEFVADHLLANGVIVPPCKVGDMVYEVIPKCLPAWGTCPYSGGYGTARCDEEPCNAYIREIGFSLSIMENIGKTVFLSREDAEKALKERSENGN